MSIIREALSRTQERSLKGRKEPPVRETIPPELFSIDLAVKESVAAEHGARKIISVLAIDRRFLGVVILVVAALGSALFLGFFQGREGVRSPIQFPVSLVQPKFRLSGIIMSDQTPAAIINNQSLAVGDSVGAAKIVAIEERKVTLDDRGERIVVSLY